MVAVVQPVVRMAQAVEVLVMELVELVAAALLARQVVDLDT
jgi:hypothetical protein